MPRSWPGYAASLVAAVATLLLVWIQGWILDRAVAAGDTVSGALILAGLLGLAIPLVLPTLWGTATLLSRPLGWVAVAGIVWLAGALAIASDLVVWPFASYVLAGLVTGLVLVFRVRLDAALAVIALVLVPYFVWSFQEFSAEEKYDEVIDQFIEARREMLAGTADAKQIELTLATERQRQEQVAELALKILPGMIGLGLLGFAGLLLLLTWLVARMLQVEVGLAKLPPFSRWRLPFYLIWLLVVGLGLIITRQQALAAAGLNLALAVGTLLSLQGAAVQWAVTGKTMGLVPRVLYLLVAGFLFLPLVVLGLADQWLDFRKLERLSDEGASSDSNGAL